jgi:hypothetical protein
MKIITTSALALSLLVSAAPLAALADDSASTNASATVEVHTEDTGSGKGIFDGLKNLVPSVVRMRAEGGDKLDATTTEMHHEKAMATSTMQHGDGEKVRAQGDTEIDTRIESLNKMIARLGDAQRLSTDAKASLTATLTAQITALTNLKAQINTEATTTLKGDTKSITDGFRIYALIMPKAAINAAADRVMTIAAQMETLSGKIGARITAAQTAGADVSAATAAHTDFDAKVADAKVQAQAAVSLVANLSVDNGDATIRTTNTAALKDAKTKLDAAQADLKAARKDVDTIVKAIKGKGEVKATENAQ